MRVIFFVDRDSIGQDNAEPYEQFWNVSYWADDSSHTLSARAIDRSNNIGESAPIKVMVTKSAKNLPVLHSPTDSALIRDANRINLKCRQFLNALKYQFQVSLNTEFTQIEFSAIVQDTAIVTMPLSKGWHFWRVRVQNQLEHWSPWSEVRKFKIDGPLMPALLSPANETIIRNTNAPRLVWTSSRFAVKYNIEASTRADFSTKSFVATVADTFAAAAALPKGVYNWRVNGQNAVGVTGEYSIAKKFKIDGPLPPQLLMPANNAVFSDQNSATLLWRRSSHAITYNAEVAFASEFSKIVNTVTISDTSVTTTSLNHGVHYWRVRAKNSVGIWGEWSSILRFGIGQLFGKTFGGNSWDRGMTIQTTRDQGFIIAARTNSFGIGDEDMWLLKTDPAGTKQWDRTFGTTGFDYGTFAQETSDGGYIAIGTIFPPPSRSGDILLVKTDAQGNHIWSRTFGGAYTDLGRWVQQTADGGYILTGSKSSNSTSTIREVWLIKTDRMGNKLWEQVYNQGELNAGLRVLIARDGGYVIAGAGRDPAIFLIKTDANGKQQWMQSFTGNNINSLNHTNDGGYLIGETTSIIKTDAFGNEKLRRALEGIVSCALQTVDGGYFIAGSLKSVSSGFYDVWLLKTDANGFEQWNRIHSGKDNDSAQYAQATRDGGYVIVGTTGSVGPENDDVWIIKTDSKGETIY